jgi:hypothetical protein
VRAAKSSILTAVGQIFVIFASLASAAIFAHPAAAQTPMCNLGSPAQIARFNAIKANLELTDSTFRLKDFELDHVATESESPFVKSLILSTNLCNSNQAGDCVLKYFTTAQDLIEAEYRASKCEILPGRMMQTLDGAIADHVYWVAKFQPDGGFHKQPTELQEQFVQFLSGRPFTASLATRWLDMHGLIKKFKVFDAARVRNNSNALDQYFREQADAKRDVLNLEYQARNPPPLFVDEWSNASDELTRDAKVHIEFPAGQGKTYSMTIRCVTKEPSCKELTEGFSYNWSLLTSSDSKSYRTSDFATGSIWIATGRDEGTTYMVLSPKEIAAEKKWDQEHGKVSSR